MGYGKHLFFPAHHFPTKISLHPSGPLLLYFFYTQCSDNLPTGGLASAISVELEEVNTGGVRIDTTKEEDHESNQKPRAQTVTLA